MKTKLTILTILITASVLIGCTATKITGTRTETPPGSGTYTTNYTTNVVVDPKLTTALETIGTINSATAPVNPFSEPITVGIGAIAAIAGWIAKRKNDALNSSATQLKAVIQGVNNVATPADVKTAIQKQAVILGIEPTLNATVQKIETGQI